MNEAPSRDSPTGCQRQRLFGLLTFLVVIVGLYAAINASSRSVIAARVTRLEAELAAFDAGPGEERGDLFEGRLEGNAADDIRLFDWYITDPARWRGRPRTACWPSSPRSWMPSIRRRPRGSMRSSWRARAFERKYGDDWVALLRRAVRRSRCGLALVGGSALLP